MMKEKKITKKKKKSLKRRRITNLAERNVVKTRKKKNSFTRTILDVFMKMRRPLQEPRMRRRKKRLKTKRE